MNGRRRTLATLAAAALLALTGCEGCGGDPPSGLSTLVPLLTPSELTVDFGANFVGLEAERDALLENSGGAPASMDVGLSGGGDFSMIGGAPDTVPPGSSVTLLVGRLVGARQRSSTDAGPSQSPSPVVSGRWGLVGISAVSSS